jgi:hypothetical protein
VYRFMSFQGTSLSAFSLRVTFHLNDNVHVFNCEVAVSFVSLCDVTCHRTSWSKG